MSHKTLEANSIPIPPYLAGLLKQNLGKKGTGFDEGAFLQQLHYWTLNPATTGWIINGTKWIYNSLKVWQAQFPWMSEYGLRKAIANLKQLGLIQTAQHWISQYKRIMFYRIDYERLSAFAADLCDLITPRCVTSDRVDMSADRTTHTDNTSDTSLAEQQTSVANKSVDNVEGAIKPLPADSHTSITYKSDPESTCILSGKVNHAVASSGNQSKVKQAKFPELIDTVAQAIAHPLGTPLPDSLRIAITRFPERVQPAISYLKHQQQQRRRQVQNPSGYLYEAITANWALSLPAAAEPSMPVGFKDWFDQAKRQGWVVAAMMIDRVHHTLHAQRGWLPTEQLMQQPSPD